MSQETCLVRCQTAAALRVVAPVPEKPWVAQSSQKLHDEFGVLPVPPNGNVYPVASRAADQWRIMMKDIYVLAKGEAPPAKLVHLTSKVMLGPHSSASGSGDSQLSTSSDPVDSETHRVADLVSLLVGQLGTSAPNPVDEGMVAWDLETDEVWGSPDVPEVAQEACKVPESPREQMQEEQEEPECEDSASLVLMGLGSAR